MLCFVSYRFIDSIDSGCGTWLANHGHVVLDTDLATWSRQLHVRNDFHAIVVIRGGRGGRRAARAAGRGGGGGRPAAARPRAGAGAGAA